MNTRDVLILRFILSGEEAGSRSAKGGEERGHAVLRAGRQSKYSVGGLEAAKGDGEALGKSR